jgi:hypothetical protein
MARESKTEVKEILASGARFSECDRYRYALWREWEVDVRRRCLFLMLNPSTADADRPDPTVTRCIRFAQSWDYDALDVANIFAWRSTDPRALYSQPNPVGPENDNAILDVASRASFIVCAWGARGKLMNRGATVMDMLRACGLVPHALRITKGGHPEHPLYLRGDSKPFAIEARRVSCA